MTPVPDTVDGRTARALRTRAAIVDACVALVDDGDVRPTTPKVAERAGVSVRSVFQHFEDLEGLYSAVADRYVERLGHLVAAVDPALPLAERIAAFVQQRSRLLEAITPVRQAAAVHAPFSDEVRSRLQSGHEFLRDEIAAAFAPELGRLAAAERTRLLDALDTALAWPSWENLRSLNATEPVDGLLRVTDQDQRPVLVEGLAQDRPLHRIGVLELVDQHDPVAGPQPFLGHRPGRWIGQRRGQASQHVVVGDELLPTLAPVDFRADRSGNPGSKAGCAFDIGRRHQRGRRVVSSCERELMEVVLRHLRGVGARSSPLAHVEVVSDLRDQVSDVLQQDGTGVVVAGRSQGEQHLLTEPVGGGHGGGVEHRQRVSEPSAPRLHLVRLGFRQVGKEMIAGRQ